MQDPAGQMTPFEDNDPIAEALRKLAPQPPGFSRDALLFAAGKAAGESRIPPWFWPASTTFFACATVILGCFLAFPTERGVQYVNVPQTVYVERIVEVKVPVPESSAAPINADNGDESNIDPEEARKQWKVRHEVLRWGVEMLPRSDSPSNTNSPRTPSAPADRGVLAAPPTPFGFPGFTWPKPKPAPIREEEDN